MNITYFKEQLQIANTQSTLLQQSSNKLSIARLVLFCLAIAALSLGYDHNSYLGYGSGGLALLAFGYLVNKHRQFQKKLILVSSRKVIIEKCLARFTNEWQKFSETGKNYLTEENPPGRDLDLFGANSLYQYLCCANTTSGKQKLAAWLCNRQPNVAEINQRQQAVAELVVKKIFSLQLQVLGNLFTQQTNSHQSDYSEKFLKQIEQATPPLSTWIKLIAYGLPGLTLLSIALTGAAKISPYSFVILIFLQLTIAGLFYGRNDCLLRPLFHFYRQLNLYRQILALIESTQFSSPYLKALQHKLCAITSPTMAIRQLYTIGEFTGMRYNLIFFLVGNGILLWDFHCLAAFINWQRSYGQQVRNWLEIIGEFEALISLSMLCHSKKQLVFPVLSMSTIPKISGVAFFHPLLIEQTAIPNSIDLLAQTAIITGSNMSGKTTFLRSIGINCCLAYAGAPVCAKQFELNCMRIFTSMRIEDDISKGISTFYAELLRIKTMVQYDQTYPRLALIDEIFKGTNSADRIIGAAAAIKKLTNDRSITLVSTHDFELCNLADEENLPIVNYHFAEFYQNDEINFDYTLKTGQSQSTNAKYLLRMAGIL